MTVHTHPDFDQHAEVCFFHDPHSGLRAIIALHRIWAQPSLGGCRMHAYDSEEAAVTDVLRLSRGMTYKSVMAGCDYGGAKAVIVGVPETGQRDAVFRAMGRVVHRLDGRFRTGVDAGLTRQDVEVMHDVGTARATRCGVVSTSGRRWDAQGPHSRRAWLSY